MKANQIKKLRQISINVAKEAGLLVLKHFHKPHLIEKKDIFDLVTEMDKAANNFITQKLIKLWPNSVMMAEEDNPDIQDVLKNAGSGDIIWIVDPIDGTTNYAKAVPHAAISIAAYDVAQNRLVAGAVYDPFRNECFSAAAGEGAYLDRHQIQVAGTLKMEDALIATGLCYKKSAGYDNNLAEISLLFSNCLGIRRFGAASLDLAWVALGRLDAYWEKDLKPWDIAAGMLLVIEAKGSLSNYQGEILDPFLGEVVASNGHLHVDFIQLLQKSRRDAGLISGK
jgi:myo-inositol-1(or 4)-monophosphatase